MEATVGLAYLLCRILDTIEDAPLAPDEKRVLLQLFLKSLEHPEARKAFYETAKTRPALLNGDDGALLLETPRVLSHLSRLKPEPQALLCRCVVDMGEGMAQLADLQKIQNETQLRHYCHIVAGTVGELLTGLYLLIQPQSPEDEAALWKDSESFAQALQRVNIAKDAGRDQIREIQFIPGLSIDSPGAKERHYRFCLQSLEHLEGALRYTLATHPKSDYRRFCALPLMLAVLTLSRIAGHPEVFSPDNGPKIPREETAALIEFCRDHAGNDRALTARFREAAASLRAPA